MCMYAFTLFVLLLIHIFSVLSLIDGLIELSHNELMSKIQPVVTRQKNTTRKEKRTAYSPYKQKTVMVQEHSEKATSPKKQKKEKKQKLKKDADNGKKQNKTNETPEKDNTTSAWRIQVRATCG